MRGWLAVLALLFASGARAQDPLQLPVLDRIIVHKSARTMDLIAHGQVVHSFRAIQLGGNPSGPKHFLGDRRTPEGHYLIDFGNGESAYRLSLHISYPSPDDLAKAHAARRAPGGAVFIHGQPNDWSGPGRVPGDWTDGCIALDDAEIEALWRATPDRTPIDIYP